MEKIKYELDPYNRLVVGKDGRKSGLSRFRQVLDGRFEVSDDNSLTYHIKAPVLEDARAPHQVKLKGEWSLNENHDLVFTLDKTRSQASGDQLTLQGEILDVNKSSLLFAVTTKTEAGVQSIYALNLEGSWQADKDNRLCFKIKKQQGKDDVLTFDGIWEIGENYQLIYQYEKTQLRRKQKELHTLTFKGQWEIKDKVRLSYVMDRNSDCVFNFKTSLGVFKDKYMKYELGIGLSRRAKPIKRIITLFGSWKFNKAAGLTFEVEYENKKVQEIAFGAEAKLTDKDKVSFNLRNNINRGIGAELELSHKILKGDGEAFLRLLKSRQEAVVLAGAGWRW